MIEMERAFSPQQNTSHVPAHQKLTDRDFQFRMAFSLLTIVACVVVMVSSAFALFHTDVSTGNSTLAGAYYTVQVNGSARVNGSADGSIYTCPLAPLDEHTFTIEAAGTATDGYCMVQVGTEFYYTDLAPGSSLTLTVQAAEGTVIAITPQWGSSASAGCIKVEKNSNNEIKIDHSRTIHATYKVQANATLDAIATYYQVSKADILTYNNITEITVGNDLLIPGIAPETQPYTVPNLNLMLKNPAEMIDTPTGDGSDPVGEVDVGDPPANEDPSAGDPAAGDGVQDPVDEIPAVLNAEDDDYVLKSESTLKLNAADILIYKGTEYQKDLDPRITGIAFDGENSCTIQTKSETLSLCFAVTGESQGYLKVIVGESEYYTVQIKPGAYVRLDIKAPVGSEIRLEAYKGISSASLSATTLYGDDLTDETDGNDPLLNHTERALQQTEEIRKLLLDYLDKLGIALPF